MDVTACESIQAFLDSDEEEDKEEVFYLPSLPFEDEDGQKLAHINSDDEYTKKSVIKRKLLKKKKKSTENIDDRSRKVFKK